MAPKSKKRDASQGKASPSKKGRAADWRTPIFYWRGVIEDEWVWSGTWVVSDSGLPELEDFEKSANTFRLTCSEMFGMLPMTEEVATFTGSYKLDNGAGLQDVKDFQHRIKVVESDQLDAMGLAKWCVVGARGTTEFGEFVSLGRLDRDFQGGVTLTLARRYIADDDPRCKMGVDEVVGRVVENGPDHSHSEFPWTALPWKVAGDWPAPLPPAFEAQGGTSAADHPERLRLAKIFG